MIDKVFERTNNVELFHGPGLYTKSEINLRYPKINGLVGKLASYVQTFLLEAQTNVDTYNRMQLRIKINHQKRWVGLTFPVFIICLQGNMMRQAEVKEFLYPPSGAPQNART
jgi:hypothetical protein